MARSFFHRHWESKRTARVQAMQDGKCLVETIKTGTVRRVTVTCPFNADFNSGARELLGRWRDKTKVWTFDTRSYNLVLGLCNRVFGEDSVTIVSSTVRPN